ncbi:MAG: hypothetical protein M3N39_04675 [Pseudomonadota bacterium]|nr:hypothetical protein [Pseudomonadota bacterium]
MVEYTIAMLMVAAAPNATAESREAFARCLKDHVRASLEQKASAETFGSSLAAACKDKEAALRNALIAADLALGLKRAASEKSAAEQLADYRIMAKEDFEAAEKSP